MDRHSSGAPRPQGRRLAGLVMVALAGALVTALFVVYLDRGLVPGDAFTYLAAGERLNAGHEVYAISPGDRTVAPKPPYWTVPLLSPPFVAVIWRPLAALPFEAGVYLWWIGSVAAIVGVMVALAVKRPVTAALAIAALAVPITYELGVGNVNGYLLLGSVASWLLFRRGHEAASGVLVAVMAATKIYPATLGVWLVAQGRRRSLLGLAGGAVGVAVVSVAGAGLSAHLQYVEIAKATGTTGVSDLSLAGIARLVGVPSDIAVWLPLAALVGGSAGVIALRRAPGPSFSLAVITMVVGSSVVNVNTPSLLLAALAPLAWPLSGAAAERAAVPERGALTALG